MMVVSEANFDLRFEIRNLKYPGTYVHVVSNSPLGGLWGHGGLQMTSEVTSGLRFEISNLNYPGTYVHVVSNSRLGGLTHWRSATCSL